ncbi:hypothetical protein Fmac_005217 [Flemingia macrophylla]|uniref:Uncharacterized protein n=1 Tax=Flemingia macrophylla TaxID=520843 RepID=A0ABD1N749_9FABA
MSALSSSSQPTNPLPSPPTEFKVLNILPSPNSSSVSSSSNEVTANKAMENEIEVEEETVDACKAEEDKDQDRTKKQEVFHDSSLWRDYLHSI